MRLINTRSYELKRFDNDHKIPPYAILSHTWGAEEVDLQQFTDLGERARALYPLAGLQKIVKACAQAEEDELNWIWVDTCNAIHRLL